ncbi:MAG: LysM peptidoglycan-binding domain-containing protein [Anaerolineales bacterium]
MLTNPNFEPPYSSGVAQGWSPWYEDSGDLCSTKPDNWDFVCRPEWTEELDYNNYGLTRGGSSQHVGAQYITWHGGVYQTVQVEPGTRVRFSVQGYSRATNDQVPAPSYGGNWVPRMQVGIDPEGRGNWAQGVTWSAENNGLDSWQSLSIEATAGESGQVSVFVSSHFRRAVPVAHQDTWWDSAVLEVVQPAATPTSTPQPTSAIPPTPVNTPTPRPDGAIVHIVQSGDTLYGIALQYDVPVDELRRLNAGTLGGNDLLVVGQEIIISVPEQTATPEPTVAPTAEATEAPAEQPAEQPEEAATPAPSGDTASLCVVAYHDRNQDRMQQPESEELLPNATFTLVGTNGTAGTYTTDGIEEPHCFENLQPDSYVLRQTPPAGYEVVGPGEMGFQLNAGQVFSYQQGYVRQQEGGADAAATPGPEATPQEETSEEGSLNITLNKVIRWAGIAVVVLLIVVAGLFFVSRRQMS